MRTWGGAHVKNDGTFVDKVGMLMIPAGEALDLAEHELTLSDMNVGERHEELVIGEFRRCGRIHDGCMFEVLAAGVIITMPVS